MPNAGECKEQKRTPCEIKFHNFAPRQENAFWPVHVLNMGICKSVSVERRLRSLPSEHLLKSSLSMEEQVSPMPCRSALLFLF